MVTAGSSDLPVRAVSEDTMPSHVRRARMLELIRERGFAHVGALSQTFGVSEPTVRQDLNALTERGHVRRVRGGAVPRSLRELHDWDTGDHADEEQAMAAAAAALVSSGDNLCVPGGPLTERLAVALVERDDLDHVVIVTNGLQVAGALDRAGARFTVIVTGGTVSSGSGALIDPFSDGVLDRFRPGTAFFDCPAVDPAAGVTFLEPQLAEMTRRMTLSSRHRVGLAAASALGRVAFAQALPLDQLDALYTHVGADTSVVRALRQHGVDTSVVDPASIDR